MGLLEYNLKGMEETIIIDNQKRNRFEYHVEDTVAFIEYVKVAEVLSLVHTEVPEELEGRGIASKMAKKVLDTARQNNLKINPVCEFIHTYIRRKPEYKDLLAEGVEL